MAHVAGRTRFADVHTSSSAEAGGAAGGLRIEETTDMGERYVVDVATGEKFIRGSRRADGTYRKDIRVRSDYVPLEERRAFQTRQQLSRSQRSQIPGGIVGGGGLVASPFPPGYSGTPAAVPVSRKSSGRSAAAAATLSPTSGSPPTAGAAAAGGSDGGRQPRSRSKKTGGGSGGGAAGTPPAAAQQQDKNKKEQQQKQQQSGVGDGVDVETQHLADAMEEKLRLVEQGGGRPAVRGNTRDVAGDETPAGDGRGSNVLPCVGDAPKTPEELRKRIRNVKKKLNEIETLRAKFEAGTSISEEQMRKLQRTEPLTKELEALEEQLRKAEGSDGPVCGS